MNSTENEGQRSTHAESAAAPDPSSENRLSDVNARTVADLVKILKLLADPTRLQVLLMLSERGETNVRAICEFLGQNQPAVSHHLALLRVAGLIEARRDGKHNFYRIQPRRIRELLDEIFAGTPEDERSIRFADYVLRYHPPQSSIPQPNMPADRTTRTDSPRQPTPPR
jgi:ArsR family transcriptional regulator